MIDPAAFDWYLVSCPAARFERARAMIARLGAWTFAPEEKPGAGASAGLAGGRARGRFAKVERGGAARQARRKARLWMPGYLFIGLPSLATPSGRRATISIWRHVIEAGYVRGVVVADGKPLRMPPAMIARLAVGVQAGAPTAEAIGFQPGDMVRVVEDGALRGLTAEVRAIVPEARLARIVMTMLGAERVVVAPVGALRLVEGG